MNLPRIVSMSLTLVAVACNVSTVDPGGADPGNVPPPGGLAGDTPRPEGCTAPTEGLTVIMTDYNSSNVGLASFDLTAKVGSFLSSGSAPPGLGLALSGDVVAPSQRPASGRIVLIDRLGKNVITWASARDCAVLGQLAVGTGFDSNPYDYLEVDERRAFVSRFGRNPKPGAQPFDGGDDLLVIDTQSFAVLRSIGLPAFGGIPARPGSLVRAGNYALVSLQRLSEGFNVAQDGAIVGVDISTEAVAFTVDLPGLENCDGLAVSPSGKRAAVACQGLYDVNADAWDVAKSDVAVLDLSTTPPTVARRLQLPAALGAAVQQGVAFATEDTLLIKAHSAGATLERLVSVDLNTGAPVELHRATARFVFGDVRCGGGACYFADAENNVVRRWAITGTGLATSQGGEAVTIETAVGLPTRRLGLY